MRIARSPPTPAPSSPLPRLRGREREVGKSFTTVLTERVGARPEAARPATPAQRVAPPAKPANAEAGRALLERLVGAETRVDALLRAAATGKTFSPAELIALQSTVFRYSQTVEVLSRVADRLVGAVKQTLGTNV